MYVGDDRLVVPGLPLLQAGHQALRVLQPQRPHRERVQGLREAEKVSASVPCDLMREKSV